jgi:hypothetical protein
MHKSTIALVVIFLLVFMSCAGRKPPIKDETWRPDNPSYFLVFHLEQEAFGYRFARGFGYLMSRQPDNRIVVVDRFLCSYGQNGWHKRAEGDRKTPTGKYMITRINKRPKSYKKFGPRTMLINYPNEYDIRLGYTGGGIVIHGGQLSSTYGCVRVLDGTEEMPEFGKWKIRELADTVPLNTTVFIADHIRSGLLGEPGDILSVTDSRQWAHLLDSELSNEEVLKIIVR